MLISAEILILQSNCENSLMGRLLQKHAVFFFCKFGSDPAQLETLCRNQRRMEKERGGLRSAVGHSIGYQVKKSDQQLVMLHVSK